MRSLAREDGKSRITYFPSRFTVGTVLSGDLSEVHAVEEEELPWLGGYTRPDKMALRVEVRLLFAFPGPYPGVPPTALIVLRPCLRRDGPHEAEADTLNERKVCDSGGRRDPEDHCR